MPDQWYYDASESPRHADAEVVYPDPDHPELQDARIVRAMLTVPSGVEKHGGDGDGDEFSDPDEGFDYKAFADQHWRTRVSQIESGEMDAHLDTILTLTSSDAVSDAIAERRTD